MQKKDTRKNTSTTHDVCDIAGHSGNKSNSGEPNPGMPVHSLSENITEGQSAGVLTPGKKIDILAEPIYKWQVIFFGIFCIQAVVLYGPTAAWLWERWTLSVWHHAHGLLILPVVGYLVWIQLRKVRDLPADSSGWGFAVLIPALVLHMLDAGMHTQLLSAFALMLALPGFALLFLGFQRTTKILFPIVFLFFTLPIPLVFTEQLHLLLRKIALVSTVNIIPFFGIPLFTEGTTIHITKGSLQIADACSGFSTLYATVAIAFLMAYMCTQARRRILVLLAAAPVAIAANIVRVVLLVLLVQWKGMDVLGTSWHTISGLFTFALALPVIFWIGYEPERTQQEI
jgi:exosortase